MSHQSGNQSSTITTDFVNILEQEGNRVLESCIGLNSDHTFKNGVLSITDKEFQGTSYKAQHLVFRDVVKIFNLFNTLKDTDHESSNDAKFMLIFLYEKLLGNDLLDSYSIEKLKQIPSLSSFKKNITAIRETSFFQPIGDLDDEFVSTLVLKKVKKDHFQTIASFLNRIALLLAKSDHQIIPKEKELLDIVSKRINNPKLALKNAKYNEVPDNDNLEKVMQELNGLVGLDHIKKDVQELINFLKVQKIREEKGLKVTKNSLHTVFMGPPGTGKTTIARLLGRIFKHLGYLQKGHLIETDRVGMVAGYVGQTAIKTDEIISSAVDGVLFVDEAYSLANGSFNDFGREAIEILLKRMEDYREKLVVIVAGYPDEMETFIQSNPGLQSRFNRYFKFDHFNGNDLMEILKLNMKKADFTITDDAQDKLLEIIDRLYEKRHPSFGNARTMRNLFEKIIQIQANRIVSIEPLTKEILITLTEEDIPPVLKTVNDILLFEED